MSKKPLAGDITVKRKVDKVQLVLEPNVVLYTLDAESALKLSESIAKAADKILQATGDAPE